MRLLPKASAALTVALLLAAAVAAAAAAVAADGSAAAVKDVTPHHFVRVRPLESPPVAGSPGTRPGDGATCERLRVPGLARLPNARKAFSVRRVRVAGPSDLVGAGGILRFQDNLRGKLEVCFHGNGSLPVGQCRREAWMALESGAWSGTAPPFEDRFLDVRATDIGTQVHELDVSVEEEFQPHRLVFLVLGLAGMWLAPLLSTSAAFYYGGGMSVGIVLVILVVLYQSMRLLPTGRKSSWYIMLYGSMMGLGTVILGYASSLFLAILSRLGIGDDLASSLVLLASVLFLLGGAALGYWGVRKFVLGEDGRPNFSTASFMTSALRTLSGVMLLQSSPDPVFAFLNLLLGITGIFAPRWFFSAWLLLRKRLLAAKNKPSTNLLGLQVLDASPATPDREPFYELSRLHHTPRNLKQGMACTASIFHSNLSGLLETFVGDKFDEDMVYPSSIHKLSSRRRPTREEVDAVSRQCTRQELLKLITDSQFQSLQLAHPERVALLPSSDEVREERPEVEIAATADMEETKEVEQE
eukprot:SM000041S15465  [mRNA]  locus=s41:226498:230115:- [translate_table: standard]